MFTSMSQNSSEAQPSPEELLAALHEAGPAALAELLGDVDFLLTAVATAPKKMFEARRRSRGEYKNLLDMVHGARSSLDALEARTVVALAEATRRDQVHAARDDVGHDDALLPPLERLIRKADAKTARDLSLATRRSPSAASSSLASARRLVGSMPRMLTSLAHGKVTSPVAYATASAMEPLDALQRRQADEMLFERMPRMDGAGVKRWRQEVSAVVGELDPHGASDRHESARKHRHVNFTPGEHGMATVSAHLPALDAKLAHKRLSLEAERRRAAGAREGHGALMADAFTDTLLGREGGMEPVTLELGVMITDRALISPEHGDLAHIEGYGPVPAEAVRAELREALTEPTDPAQDRYGPDGPQVRVVMRRLYGHPTAGELVAVESRSREFPPGMKRFLDLRDGICRAPFCDAPVRQVDHIVPFSEGGATSIDNGQGLCGHCNVSKEEDAAQVKRIDDPGDPGHLVAWTGHGGTTVVTAPPSLGPLMPAGADSEPQPPEITGSAGVDACLALSPLTCRIPLDEMEMTSTIDPQPPRVRRRPGRLPDRQTSRASSIPNRSVLRPPCAAARPSSRRAAPARHRRPPRAGCSPSGPHRSAAPPARSRSS